MYPSHPAADRETVVIAAGADERYALGLAVALSSALRNLEPSRRVHVFVFDGGLTPASRERCLACLGRARPDAEVTLVEDDPARFAGLDAHHYSKAAFLRLLIAEVVPDKYRRVLYLDSDLVVEGDIAELWSLPDEGSVFWAAFDDGVRKNAASRDRLGFAGVPDGTPYFNSGVLLIEVPRWKAESVSERAVAVLNRHGERCIYPDQDALNVVAMGRWSVLPQSWNTQVFGLEAWSPLPDETGEAVNLTHYIHRKPWRPEDRCLRKDAFCAALLASGWCSPAEYRRAYWQLQHLRARQWARGLSAFRPIVAARRRWRHAAASLGHRRSPGPKHHTSPTPAAR